MASWFYYDSLGFKHGPISSEDLQQLASKGKINVETAIETEGGKKSTAGKIQGLIFAEVSTGFSDTQSTFSPPPVPPSKTRFLLAARYVT